MKAPRPRSIVFAAWAITIAYAWPGYMSWDAGEQLFQARTANFNDWYPPVMSAYWKLLDWVVRGPLLMLLLQTSVLAWGLFALVRTRFDERSAAWIAAGLMLFPPILTPMSAVWKDAQMAAFLVAGVALALRPERAGRALGLILLFLAAAVRDNAALALPPLLLLVGGAWGVKRRVAAGVCVAIVAGAALLNMALTRTREYPWYRSVAIADIAGTICHAGPMTDGEIAELLAGTSPRVTIGAQQRVCALYTPRVWFALSQAGNRVWDDSRDPDMLHPRRAAWWRTASAHPLAYLEHRAAVMAEVLGLSDDDVWEPVCHDFEANLPHRHSLHHDASPSWLQRTLGGAFDVLGRTIVYRAWAYALLALVFFGYALARRDRWLVAILGSGLLYEASYFFLAPSPDFRYSHWMILCTAIAGVTIFVERLRQRLRREGVV
jgi:hypothetical protein